MEHCVQVHDRAAGAESDAAGGGRRGRTCVIVLDYVVHVIASARIQGVSLQCGRWSSGLAADAGADSSRSLIARSRHRRES
jgi:hypothetical protein